MESSDNACGIDPLERSKNVRLGLPNCPHAVISN